MCMFRYISDIIFCFAIRRSNTMSELSLFLYLKHERLVFYSKEALGMIELVLIL